MKALDDLIADKLEKADEPDRLALLQIPLENIRRWKEKGHSAAHRLDQWEQILKSAIASPSGFQALLALMRDRSEPAVHLKSFDPFPGVLTTEERQHVLLECAYAH